MAGAVQGVQGAQYANRTDLAVGGKQPAQAATGQPYGAAKQQLDAQAAVPVGTPALPPFGRPSERPNEPLHAGMSSGPGPGPEVLTAGVAQTNDVLPQLLAMYRVAPYEDLRRLIERVQRTGQ